MEASGIPTKFPTIWGAGATTGYVRTVPVAASATPGVASFTTGFPSGCFSPVAAGGVPPFGQDFNGILQAITQWNQWQQAGAPITYDATFQAAIGGYPNGAVIQSTVTPGLYWRSTTDSNTTDPDTGGAGWVIAPSAMFPSSLTTNGSKKYPDPNSPTGYFIEQWGVATVASPTAVTFSVAFPNACLSVQAGEGNANSATWGTGRPTVHGAENPTVTGYTGWSSSWNGATWIAGNNAQTYRALGY